MKSKEINHKIRFWYETEKELAAKLRNSTWDERKLLYKTLYTELFKRVPWHPRLIIKEDDKSIKLKLHLQLRIIGDSINRDTVFMEIGPGDCRLALALTEKVRQVYAIDISDELVKKKNLLPDNFKLIISDGTSIKVPISSVDVAYSYQFIEHLHPDDMGPHLRNVRNALKPGGIYIFLTPHRFRGPHDVSKYFDQVATGLHLKEWIFSELIDLLRAHKYSKARLYCIKRGLRFRIPVAFIKIFERFLGKLSYYPRKKISNLVFRGRYYIVARK